MNGYNLSRDFYSFKFLNPEKVKAVHSDLYHYIIDLWNRLGQKEKFGLPTSITMECLGIGSYNTYKKALSDLVDFGFLIIISESKNQHQSKIIAISKNDKATDKALDKATIKATIKATDKASDEPTDKAIDTIIKQINNITINKINKEQYNILSSAFKNFENTFQEFNQKEKPVILNEDIYINLLLEYGFDKNLILEWFVVRKNKNVTNSTTFFKGFIKTVSESGIDKNEVLKICVENSWATFKKTWYDNLNKTNTNGTATAKKANVQYSDDFLGKIANALQS